MKRATRTTTLCLATAAALTFTALQASASDTDTGTKAQGDSQAQAAPRADVPAFYDPPAELPAANGDLVRSEDLPLAVSLPGLDGPFPGKATRLMYKSTDSNDGPVAVTGAYIEPTADWEGEGPRPLVALAPGTMGQGDQCSASLGLEHPISFNGKSVSVGYEDIAVYRLLAAGAAVVVTDYAGLGATDRLHTYVNRVDGGHALLDAARAARAVPGASVTEDSKVALYGYSQGGGASGSATELQSSYAPDVQLTGAYVGAPPADLTEVIKGIDGSALAGALGWSLNGFLQSDPSLQEVADRRLNADGAEALEDLSGMCIGDAIFKYGFSKSAKWTTDGKSLSDVVAEEPAVQATLDDQRIGKGRPSVPVRLATGIQDDIVPHEQARQLAVDWCEQGADVTYAPIALPNLGDGLVTNHVAPLLTDQGDAISWLKDRLSGKETTSNCAELPDRD